RGRVAPTGREGRAARPRARRRAPANTASRREDEEDDVLPPGGAGSAGVADREAERQIAPREEHVGQRGVVEVDRLELQARERLAAAGALLIERDAQRGGRL